MIEPARRESLTLLSHALGRTREWIVAHPEARVPQRREQEFLTLCERRARGVPMAYILGSAGFYGREFLVNESVLVPRPETEHLIDEALEFLGSRTRLARVLDVGTGSGAIACTLAGQTNARVDAVDVSSDALRVAKENARRLNVAERCTFYHGDLVEPVLASRYDVAIANLPYIPSADVPRAPNPLGFEPRVALDGGPDGLVLYRRLLRQLPRILNPKSLVLLEAAPPSIEELKRLVASSFPGFTISVGRDYAGLARYIKATS